MEDDKVAENVADKTQRGNRATLWLAVLLGLAVIGAGFLGWQYNNLRNDKQVLTSANTTLQAKIDDLKKQLKTAQTSSTSKSTTTKVTIPQSLIDNIQAALNTMNTAALEGYMAPSVNVVFAASEKQGPRTPAQAVSDLDYLKNATAPWDFNLPAPVLSSYGKGSYSKYFGQNTTVGKSANKYVASFEINSSGKIVTIFISADDGLLQ